MENKKEYKPSNFLGLLILGWIVFAIAFVIDIFICSLLFNTDNDIAIIFALITICLPGLLLSDILYLIASILFFIAFGKSVSQKKDFDFNNGKIVISLIFAILSILLIVLSFFIIKLVIKLSNG